MKFIEIVKVTSVFQGADEPNKIEVLDHWQTFINVDYIASFGYKKGSQGKTAPIGFINLALSEEEYNVSYNVSIDTIKRLQEFLDAQD